MENCKTVIGAKIRSLREQKSITIEQVAQMSGLNAQYLEVIEQDAQAPTIGELIKISRALGVRVGTILDDFSTDGPAITRAEERVDHPVLRSSSGNKSKMNYFSLSSKKQDRNMEIYMVDVFPKPSNAEMSSHEGEEFVIVLEGVVEIIYGKETYYLKKGDTIYYDSIVPHFVGSKGEEGARIMAAVYMPA